MNEGMPIYRSPFDKGRLILAFTVSFPPDHFLPASKLIELEKLLPPRNEIMIPDDAEEAILQRFDPTSAKEQTRKRPEAYDSDEEDRSGQHQRVQCASQ